VSSKIERSALVGYSASQMYALVNDIESYPNFMDGCVGAEVLRRGDNWLEARLDLAKAGVKQSFATRNELFPPYRMTMDLLEGPFQFLRGVWEFTPLSDHACKVSFTLQFEMKNRLLGMAVGKLFEGVGNRQVEALCERAKHIYG
jgi:ribosome-associated toxin RatA of RatAB toxin-antitoxin module